VPTISIATDGAARARAELERCIQSGGVAIFPADGLYGLACDPLNEEAIRRIYEIKGRDDGKPAAVMYFSVGMLRELVGEMAEPVRRAAAALLPGPVTLVIPNPTHRYPAACRADLNRLGIRLIEGPLAGATCPIFQTSANFSGEPAPARFEDIPGEILAAADLAIDGGELTGQPSTVVDLTAYDGSSGWRILRQGGLPAGDLERLLGRA
jgi:L-threonylcarbamoyladenylate synthase